MHYQALMIYHAFTVMVLGLYFYTEDPDSVGGAVKKYVPVPVSISGIRGGPSGAEVGHGLWRRGTYLLIGYDPGHEKKEGGTSHQLGGGRQAYGGTEGVMIHILRGHINPPR